MLLTSLIYTPIARSVDRLLLDDYDSSHQQTYIGAGVSALTVPVKQIYDLVVDQTVGGLISVRLLNQALPRSQELFDETQEVLIEIEAMLKHQYLRDMQMQCQPFGQQGIDLPSEPNYPPLRYHLTFNEQKHATLPVVDQITIEGKNPLSTDLNLQVMAVLGRLNAESISRKEMTRKLREVFEEQQQIRLDSIMAPIHRKTADYLRRGDGGLLEALEFLRLLREQLEARHKKYEAALRDIKESRDFHRLREYVDGHSRWYFDSRRLSKLIQLRPRLPALLIRCTLLLVLINSIGTLLSGIFSIGPLMCCL
jgi:hypothetical protein